MAFTRSDWNDVAAQERRLDVAIASFTAGEVERIRHALAFARDAHAGQLRKGSIGTPYIVHPVRVAASLVEELGIRDADAIAAALLHDVVEDCDVSLDAIAASFSDAIAGAVRWLTWVPGRDAKWMQARALLDAPMHVRAVKAADIIDNARDIAATPSVGRRIALRSYYGYGRWGRLVVASLDRDDALRLLDDALAAVRGTHFSGDREPLFRANVGKVLTVRVSDANGAEVPVTRYPVRTSVIAAGDDLFALVRKYALEALHPDDTLAISERVVAITQGRAYRIDEIRPRWLATQLVRFVSKNPAGIGLAIPQTMELALREAGTARILLAAFVSAITRPFGVRGLFYRLAGHSVNAIDGPCDYTLPPYNAYAVLGPKDPDDVAAHLARRIGVDIAIIDANDLGVVVLGASDGVDRDFIRRVFKDNPLGQSAEQTPMAIVRRRDEKADL
ncbi:MAG: HD domain-containing protein [bacterium]|nr:HD domain-containing protein [bacterium]